MQKIIEIPTLKEGNGKELRALHDTAQQHIRALKCMGHEPSKTFLQEDNLVPSKWPLARVLQVHPGKDGLVRVATVKTSTGIYKRSTCKLALLLPQEEK